MNLVAGGLLERTDASALTTDEVFGFVAAGTPLRKATSVKGEGRGGGLGLA